MFRYAFFHADCSSTFKQVLLLELFRFSCQNNGETLGKKEIKCIKNRIKSDNHSCLFKALWFKSYDITLSVICRIQHQLFMFLYIGVQNFIYSPAILFSSQVDQKMAEQIKAEISQRLK